MGNPFCYVEFHSRDRERFVAFYGQLFDWAIQHSIPGYSEIRTGGAPSGGLTSAADDMQPGILIYVQVDDILETVSRAQGLGGRQIQPMTQVPGTGSFAVIEDPDGNKLGLFTPAPGTQPRLEHHGHAHDVGHDAHGHADDSAHGHADTHAAAAAAPSASPAEAAARPRKAARAKGPARSGRRPAQAKGKAKSRPPAKPRRGR